MVLQPVQFGEYGTAHIVNAYFNVVLRNMDNNSVIVVYFNQGTVAPNAVCWSKSFGSAIKQVFFIFFCH